MKGMEQMLNRFPDAETTGGSNESKNPIEARIEADTKMATELKDRGYISSFRIYEDPNGFETYPVEKIEPDLRMYFEILAEQMKGPVLRDDIEDNDHGVLNKEPRQKIRDTLYSEILVDEEGSPVLDQNKQNIRPKYNFNESNKLQQSNVANMVSILGMVALDSRFPSDLAKEIQDLTEDFTTPKEGEQEAPINSYGLSHPRYKYVLDNKGRYDFVDRLEDVTERAMLAMIALSDKK